MFQPVQDFWTLENAFAKIWKSRKIVLWILTKLIVLDSPWLKTSENVEDFTQKQFYRNVLNGLIGKQMVDTLVESQSNVETILKFFDMFLKLKDLTTSQAFQEFDSNKDGWISPKEFQRAMETQKMYSIEKINYLMMCTDVNNDGKVDYMEFTERFHNPAKDIGFNFAVLLTNLNQHIVGDNRLQKILNTAKNMLDYFDKYLGRIEIMGSSTRVEKVYFEIKDEWLEQFNKPQS